MLPSQGKVASTRSAARRRLGAENPFFQRFQALLQELDSILRHQVRLPERFGHPLLHLLPCLLRLVAALLDNALRGTPSLLSSDFASLDEVFQSRFGDIQGDSASTDTRQGC